METTISQEILGDPSLKERVEAANAVLLQGVGRAPHPPRAVWRLIRREQKSPLIELELFFHDESLAKQFSPEDLCETFDLRYRLSNFWGDLILQSKSRTIARLVENLRALEERDSLLEVS